MNALAHSHRGPEPLVGRAVAAADYDRDGDLDLVLTQPAGAPRLLRNDRSNGHHWIELRLEGDPGRGIAREPIGAWVEIEAGGRRQRRTVTRTRGYLAQCPLPVRFGLGDAAVVDRVTVHWPGGSVSELRDLTADRSWSVGPDGLANP